MTDFPSLTDAEVADAEARITYPFFVYGTLRPEEGNSRTWHGLAQPRHDGEATVEGFRLVGRGFPYALPAEGHTATGCLIVPDPDSYDIAKRQMDMLEGYNEQVPEDGHYSRQLVTVNTPGGTVTAWIYVPCRPEHYMHLKPVPDNDWYELRDEEGFARGGWWTP